MLSSPLNSLIYWQESLQGYLTMADQIPENTAISD